MDKENFTELKVFYKYPGDFGTSEISSKIPVWDVSISQMIQMFRTLMVGMAFSEDTIIQGFIDYIQEHRPECEIYYKENADSNE